MKSADEREVNDVESIKGKARYDFTSGPVDGLRWGKDTKTCVYPNLTFTLSRADHRYSFRAQRRRALA